MARYLIEPNEDDVLLFDMSRSQDIVIIKSVFRKLVESYTLLSEDEENSMGNELGEVIIPSSNNKLMSE